MRSLSQSKFMIPSALYLFKELTLLPSANFHWFEIKIVYTTSQYHTEVKTLKKFIPFLAHSIMSFYLALLLRNNISMKKLFIFTCFPVKLCVNVMPLLNIKYVYCFNNNNDIYALKAILIVLKTIVIYKM